MRAIVAFDSIYGNTRKVAETIVVELIANRHKATLVSVRERQDVPDADILFIGSPTRLGRMTGRTRRFITRMDEEAWKGTTVVPFDTFIRSPDQLAMIPLMGMNTKGAAPRLAEMLRSKGMDVKEPLRVGVEGRKGPLATDYKKIVKTYLNSIL
ncbi:MAG: flavodoxin [Methanomassiliicoccales archaeon PtaU1.Bin124]|nr:MAG: flavodoxin [Methanomassiliicoccales archaeon PtaU1.Bin124]